MLEFHDAVDEIVESRWQRSDDTDERSSAYRVDTWIARWAARWRARAKLEWRVAREWMRWRLADGRDDAASSATVEYSAVLVGAGAAATMLGFAARADALVARANALHVVIRGQRVQFFLFERVDGEDDGPMIHLTSPRGPEDQP